MKSVNILFMAITMLGISASAIAQKKTETFRVSGNCGMCKSKIEKAAKEAGAQKATWNKDTKQLTVTYKSSSTSLAKIQQKIADIGYDNDGFKATTEAYNKLHSCCKYDREVTSTTEEKACCKKDKAGKDAKNGKDCCKEDKDSKCSKEPDDSKGCCKKTGKERS